VAPKSLHNALSELGCNVPLRDLESGTHSVNFGSAYVGILEKNLWQHETRRFM
jgi:hypothetical protein